MIPVSNDYKIEMRKPYRNASLVLCSLGVINQHAQSGARIDNQADYAYYSDFKKLFQSYDVSERYATCDNDYTRADGKFFFMPRTRDQVALNNGAVSKELSGSIRVDFDAAHDVKGLTIDFSDAYPIDFDIVTNQRTVQIRGNASRVFITQETFDNATYIRIVPYSFVNGISRLHIYRITFGVGLYFDSAKIKSINKREYLHPIMAELPALDINVEIDNKDKLFNIEDDTSSINYLQLGQEISVNYGLMMDSGGVEWIKGATAFLREWSADDEVLSLTASDVFDGLNDTYVKGLYRADGISIYDLAVDVLTDAGVDIRKYRIDTYFKSVKVSNPLPAVTHKECLQIIANAGRGVLYQDNNGVIVLKPSFEPDKTAISDNATYYSNVSSILDGNSKPEYANTSLNHPKADSKMLFLPRAGSSDFLDVGYVSEAVSDASGGFANPPSVTVTLESVYTTFGLSLVFGDNPPSEYEVKAYRGNILTDTNIATTASIEHEFAEFDKLEIRFIKTSPYNRIVLKSLRFGAVSDYVLSYQNELVKSPKGTQLAKVKDVKLAFTSYGLNEEIKDIGELQQYEAGKTYTIAINQPSYDYALETPKGVTAEITESSCFFVKVRVNGGVSTDPIKIKGREYIQSKHGMTKQINTVGTVSEWSNPLASTEAMARDVLDWIAWHVKSDRTYELSYRGEPRIEGNDVVFLETNKGDMSKIRIVEHDLKFNGGLSGTIKARKEG